MIHNKRNLIVIIFLLIILQFSLYFNNKQKSSFRFFIWNFEEIKIGRIINISFFSGLLISSLINKTKNSYTINKKDDDDIDEVDNNDDFYSESSNEVENISNIEMPPQRDLRDTQPTISVNYRIIKNNGERNIESKDDFLNNSIYQDDWNNDQTDW